MSTSKRLVLVLGSAAAALALAACGGSTSSVQSAASAAASAVQSAASQAQSAASQASSAVASASESMVGGMTTCDETTMAAAVKAWSDEEGTKAVIGERGFVCSGDWAVVHMSVTGSGGAQIEQNLVLRAEGQFWVPQDPGKVCKGTNEVPEDIYPDVCEAQ